MPPPRIIEHPMDITVPVGVIAIFKCVGQGYGNVDISWLRGSGNLRQKSNVTTIVISYNITSILTIPDLNNRDERDYRCVYNNSEGPTRSSPGRLTIGSKCSHITIIQLHTLCSYTS